MNEHHGDTGTRLHDTWRGMRQRCYNKNVKNYSRYGGRGITMCDEWRESYLPFKEWSLSHGYVGDLKRGECTLDRIDNNGPYSPENCRWVSAKVQDNNKSDNRIFSDGKESHTIAEWSDISGVPYSTLYNRLIKHGWDIKRAISEGYDRKKYLTYKGETKRICEWEAITGINRTTLMSRIRRNGMSVEEAFEYKRGPKRVRKA